jgi:hypothetical protein
MNTTLDFEKQFSHNREDGRTTGELAEKKQKNSTKKNSVGSFFS